MTGTNRPPIRMVHLGLGAFHRAHQAWYTHQANELSGSRPWGIAAFTGRSPRAAESLTEQDGLYTLLIRDRNEDRAQVISSIVEAVDGNNGARWRELLATPDTAVLTVTVTEAGYHHHGTKGLDYGNAEVDGDIRLLRSSKPATRAARSAPGRIVDGLRARRDAGAGPLALVSCDNLNHNGDVTRTVVLQMATSVDENLAHWIDANVSFVSTMVDRITPATTAADCETASRLTGFPDRAPVVTEPFAEWILAGEFPAGRPAWELAGARFVDDIRPFEERKLWLLNAGHSLLAYTGMIRGYQTIADTMKDPECVELLEELWSDARPVLPFSAAEIDAGLQDLRTRFQNPRIEHQLTQIAADGSIKLRMRSIPVIRRRLAQGLDPGRGQAALIAAWLRCLRSPHIDFHDRGADSLVGRRDDGPAHSSVDERSALALLDSELAKSPELVAAVVLAAERLGAATASTSF
ncbi:fructuronate reductase [Arthrobacter pigmenti]|uniref:Mannitol-1-phosphate 5-dehydrogenase n=1 Tax=Arthrobacter pigmenti TaxID=271432 RepID=A0A846RRE3_9MICC|nr:mannitol dehydrogenase family protein [Arthrobacter pigmenti]NJC21646.1 fructuronate reductase [Arthrobacter pigmenti]